MTSSEQSIINTVIKNLENSYNSASWSKGNLEQWADYANNMRSAIRHNIAILKTITSESSKESGESHNVVSRTTSKNTSKESPNPSKDNPWN